MTCQLRYVILIFLKNLYCLVCIIVYVVYSETCILYLFFRRRNILILPKIFFTLFPYKLNFIIGYELIYIVVHFIMFLSKYLNLKARNFNDFAWVSLNMTENLRIPVEKSLFFANFKQIVVIIQDLQDS